MKRILILALTVLMLAAVLCACGTTAYVDDPYRGYSNVSTTHDGTVNGTNGYGYNNGGYAGTNGYTGGMTGTNGYANGGTNGYANGNTTTGNGTTTTTTTGTARSGMGTGTGMAGGR